MSTPPNFHSLTTTAKQMAARARFCLDSEQFYCELAGIGVDADVYSDGSFAEGD
jgi:hypothetical protein